jgi:hypothetical protein
MITEAASSATTPAFESNTPVVIPALAIAKAADLALPIYHQKYNFQRLQ